jgi:hypothetical protein
VRLGWSHLPVLVISSSGISGRILADVRRNQRIRKLIHAVVVHQRFDFSFLLFSLHLLDIVGLPDLVEEGLGG